MILCDRPLLLDLQLICRLVLLCPLYHLIIFCPLYHLLFCLLYLVLLCPLSHPLFCLLYCLFLCPLCRLFLCPLSRLVLYSIQLQLILHLQLLKYSNKPCQMSFYTAVQLASALQSLFVRFQLLARCPRKTILSGLLTRYS